MPDRSPAASSPAPSRPALRSSPLQPMVPASSAPSAANRARFPGADGGSPSVRTVVPMTTGRPSRLAAATAASTSVSMGPMLAEPGHRQAVAGQADRQVADPGQQGQELGPGHVAGAQAGQVGGDHLDVDQAAAGLGQAGR